MMWRKEIFLVALAALACRSECERALEERVGVELPRGARLFRCEYHDVTQMKNSFRIEAEFLSEASLSDLADEWDLQATGLSDNDNYSWVLRSAPLGIAPGRTALRIRNNRMVALRKFGDFEYHLYAANTTCTDETKRAPSGPRSDQ